MKIPLVNLKAIHEPLREQILSAVTQVIDSGRFILGPEVEGLEHELANYLDVTEAIGVSSGTDALLAALMALDVGHGDEVVTTPYSFFATAGVVARMGARPTFVDICPRSFNLDPNQLEDALTPKTRAILVVHLYGRAADMDAINAIAERHGIPVIEDAAQAIGAEWQGRRVGGLGTIGCFSFFPTKNLGGMGDGGLVTTQSEALAKRLRSIRKHGSFRRNVHEEVGGNFRLDPLQAAILRAKLPELDKWTSIRQQQASAYHARFQAAGLGDLLECPESGTSRHVWNQYVVRFPQGHRDQVASRLKEASIGQSIYYPVPLHRQPCFEHLGHGEGSYPEAERAAQQTLAIPVAPGLTPTEMDDIVDTIKQALED